MAPSLPMCAAVAMFLLTACNGSMTLTQPSEIVVQPAECRVKCDEAPAATLVNNVGWEAWALMNRRWGYTCKALHDDCVDGQGK